MARGQETQRQRTQNNPLVLGSFDTTALKYLKGSLGPLNKVVGRADSNQQSNGGFGGGTYNHWFQINLKNNAWIIVAKAGTRPNYIQTSVYDLNKIPIEGRGVFLADSVETVMGAQSDLYNTFSFNRLDKGDERYYPLSAGGYLLCISTTRNEILSYEVGVVIEFPPTEMDIALEDEDSTNLLLQETAIDFSRTIEVVSPIAVNIVISPSAQQPNGFTESLAVINPSVTVTVLFGSTWLIGNQIPSDQGPQFSVFAEPGNDEYFNTIHDHSLFDWRESWEATHQDSDKFPDVFIPLANK